MMLQEIYDVVVEAVGDVFRDMLQHDYNAFMLFIGRADFVPGLKGITGTDYVIDYQRDRYHDATREAFYCRYMERNYHKAGFSYGGDSGIDDLSIEMMIYTHLWDSMYFLKSIYRIANILSGEGYTWNPKIPLNGKYRFMQEKVIKPLEDRGYKLGAALRKGYKSSLRNAFAHALYTVDKERRLIYLRPSSSPYETLSFDEFQERFLYSVIMMYMLRNKLEAFHNEAAAQKASTEPFYTPDGVRVRIYAEMKTINNREFPRFHLLKVAGI